jgi:sec-independent protein translocase protein TatB
LQRAARLARVLASWSLSVFDLSFLKLLVLGVIALVVFGPERLPAMAAQAGRALRELRTMAEGARSDLQDSLGTDLSEFDLADLNPKHFVRKHLLDELSGDGVLTGRMSDAANGSGTAANGSGTAASPVVRLAPGESPPYDSEAT